jgi:hypothetical protein
MTSRIGDDRFAAFDIMLKRRGRGRWKWSVRTVDGHAVMSGSECSRGGARYKAERALFLLLCSSASRLLDLPPERSHVVRGAASRNARTSEP